VVTWIWWAPLGAATLHIAEEFVYPGGFAAWDRAYRPVFSRSITSRLHLVVNALLLAACAAVGLAGLPEGALLDSGLRFRSGIPASLAVPAWLALTALLFSNAIFHIVGSYRTKQTSPGVRTGVLLYIPLAVVGYWYFLSTGQVSAVVAAVAAIVGGSYHLWASLAHRSRSRPRSG